MNIQGFQKLTLLDFPGTMACIVFTGGCNFRCPFCHNSSLVLKPKENNNLEKEVLQYLAGRKNILDGVCITGGEPLLQPDLIDFIAKVRELGYRVKLDTNGYSPEKLKEVLDMQFVDYVAMDIKSGRSTYEKLCGTKIDFSKIEQSIELLKSSNVPYEFRTTAVKHLHTMADFAELAQDIAGAPKYYIQKFVDSGAVLEQGYTAFTEEEMKTILEIVQRTIPNAAIR